jgi:hypothetical protein
MTCLHPTSIPKTTSSTSKAPSRTRTIMSTVDIELAPQSTESPTRGFALVASKIDSDIDKITTIYRRFDELSARNLLFYQAELLSLRCAEGI